MAKYECWIPEYRPESLNTLINAHWAARNNMKKNAKVFVSGYTAQARIPKATGKRKVSYHFVITSRMKEYDDDNAVKILNDALVACGMLTDDNRAGVELGEITYSRSPDWGTKIIIEDIA